MIYDSQIRRMHDATYRKYVDANIGRLFFRCKMSFNIARPPLWKDAVRMINNTSQGYAPSRYEKLYTIILNEKKTQIESTVQDIKESCSAIRVSILSDGWTDITNRPLINILVYSLNEVMLLKSHDILGHMKDATYPMGLV